MKEIIILEGKPFDWDAGKRAMDELSKNPDNIAAAHFADPGCMSCPQCGEFYWKEGSKVKCVECGHVWDVV